jgi:hypothetical protein
VIVAAPSKKDTGPIELTPLRRETAIIEIVGTAPLIVHRFSEETMQIMLDGMTGKKSPRKPKDPDAEYEASVYRLSDGREGIKTLAFKRATVDAARLFTGITMTELRPVLYVHPDDRATGLVAIRGERRMRVDPVTVGVKSKDLRYRAEYLEWEATLKITFMPHVLSLGSLVSLVDAGGGGGVGDWRPDKNGLSGTYEVVKS